MQAGHWAAPELAANLAGYLEAGQLFLLFDALNEMPHEEYTQRALALRRFIDYWSAKGNRFLVTCRVLDYGEELSGLKRVEVQPLNEEQIQELLRKELPAHWPTLWQEFSRAALASAASWRWPATPTYLLTIMIDIFAEDGELSQNRAELMGRFTQILMDWAKKKCPASDWLDAAGQAEETGCCGAARGTTMSTTPAALTATGTIRTIGTTTGVVGWWSLPFFCRPAGNTTGWPLLGWVCRRGN